MLVTGGAGFVGQPLVEALAAEGCAVTVLDRAPSGRPDEGSGGGSVRRIAGDFADPQTVGPALDGVGVLYHLACSTVPATSAADPPRDVEDNVLGSVRLFEAAAVRGIEKIVYPSSGGTVYGHARRLPIDETHATDPIGVHGATKLAIERYLVALSRQRGFTTTVARIANPYGPGQWRRRDQGIIGALLRAVATGEPVAIWGDGSVVRDYLFLDDAVRALAAARLRGDGAVVNVGSGRGRSIKELLEAVERVTGSPVPVRWEPERGFDVEANVLDPERARAVLGWEPRVPLDEGIARMWTAYPEARGDAGVDPDPDRTDQASSYASR